MFHFPRTPGVHYRIPSNVNWMTMGFGIWECLTGERPAGWDKLFASKIHNPTIRYFHRILSNTIMARSNNNKVNARELFIMHCFFSQESRINASSFIFQHIHSLISRDGTTLFCIGGLVTSIAIKLNLWNAIEEMPTLTTTFLDI